MTNNPVPSDEPPLESVKHILCSKVLWTNILAFIAFAIQKHYGFMIDESLQAQLLMIINIILRFFTKEPLGWK
jgi:hypothetical protein